MKSLKLNCPYRFVFVMLFVLFILVLSLSNVSFASPPPAVTNLYATSYNETVMLNWTGSAQATGYLVYRQMPDQTSATLLDETTRNEYINIVPGTGIYYYMVYPYADVNGERFVGEGTQAAILVDIIPPEVVLSGADRFATSVAISKASFQQAETIVLAYGRGYPDSLAGVPLAYHLNGPLLLTETNELPVEVRDEIKRLGAKKAVILGLDQVVSSSVETNLQAMGLVVERIGGATRYDTSVLIGRKVQQLTNTKAAFVVSGENFADGLSAGPAAALQGAPILLSPSQNHPTSLLNAISNLNLTSLKVIGGTLAISDSNFQKLKAVVPDTNRYGDASRYATGVLIAETFLRDARGIGVAYAKNFPDAMTGGVHSARIGVPLILVDNVGSLDGSVVSYLERHSIRQATFFGGDLVIPPAVRQQVIQLLK